MATEMERRIEMLATLKRDLQAQDAAWKRACEALARLGDANLPVPDDFRRQLDALASTSAAESIPSTNGAVRA